MTEDLSRSQLPVFDWLTLERIPGVGPITIARLIDAFGSPRAALEAPVEQIRIRARLSERVARNIAEFTSSDSDIQNDMKILEGLDAKIMTRWDLDYPENLKEIYDPPALLFVRGKLIASDKRSVAVVGTRNPSRYGLEMAESITRDLVRAGITVVSGLARGIDTACHRSALKSGGRTIGVLGCGIDVYYPRENKSLLEDMIEQGAVISEFRPGIRPFATNFYRRNRIVSGLTKGTLVVEAAPKSGSLITASHALDQNREVFALPGSILNKRSWGPHHLLRQGAALVESANDIVTTLFGPISTKQPVRPHGDHLDMEGLSEKARSVLDSIDLDPVPIDSLCMSLKIDAGKLSGLLLDLELRGLIKQHPGKMFSKIS